jgi:hypothetical protein
MTAPECRGCPFPDQTAALELVRLREGIGRLASEWEVPVEGRQEYARLAFLCAADELRALLDDSEGER